MEAQKNNPMKKLIVPMMLTGLSILSSCGPNKQQQEANEKMRQDSIRVADSIANVRQMAADKAKQMADSLAAVHLKMDSIARADSLVNAKTTKKPAKMK
ncbi:MAG TPA: hypothetical protein VE978_19450 [Chitinophagales bacterium]|nr:hypothetical protein [Chitinophagales bacterium]